MPTFSIHTLGCRLNQADSATVAGDLTAHGYQSIPWGEPSDIAIINSCAVTGVASQKTRQAVRAARKRLPNAFIVLIGCEATVCDIKKYPEVNLIVPNPKPAPLSQLIAERMSCDCGPFQAASGDANDDFLLSNVSLYDERTRANLKIQDGCNFFCTYCIVPHTRGPARSRNLEDLLREATELIRRGHREIVLTGVNITTYQNSGCNLADVIERILALGDGFRIRIGSAEPGPVVGQVIDVMSRNPRLCRFLHLPVQYGEDSLLQQMGRHYSAADFERIAMLAAEKIPGLCLGTDVIVGFPGETDETFAACKAFLSRLPFGLLHIFTYSPRPGTPAATMPGRPPKHIAEERSKELLALAVEKAEIFAKSQVGKTLDVLIEDENPLAGWSDNYLHVTVNSATTISRNTILPITITAATGKREVTGT
ncbi:MAG: MiaB/RimO family radical SAM methylthiotransferase [Victivallales bacterium]|nr:MiaB/RimO family radical SAM methylthiotransferase [Victivallales bacterium]